MQEIDKMLFSSEQSEFQYAVDSSESIFPTDLFTFGICPSIIGYPYFIDPQILITSEFLGDFRFKTESILYQMYFFDDIRFEKLVACFHIAEIEIRKHIWEESEQLISYAMPEKEYPMRLASHKSGSVYHIGKSIFHRLQKQIIFLRIIFQIGILDDEILSRRLMDTRMQRSSFAFIDCMMMIRDIQILIIVHIFFDSSLSIIFRTIIDDDDLFLDIVDQYDLLHFIQDTMDCFFFIVRRDDNRQFFHHLVFKIKIMICDIIP